MRFDFDSLMRYSDVFLEGLVTTLAIAALSSVLSLLLAFLFVVVLLYGDQTVRRLLGCYIEVMRNTPLLVTIYLIYFGLPHIGIMTSTFVSIVIAIVMQHSAFLCEVLRGGFLAIPRSQIAAAEAIGMTRSQVFRFVLVPQASVTALPGLVGGLILLLQDTSLGAAISIVDLTMAAKVVSQRTATSLEPFIVIAAMYLCLSLAIGHAGRRLEARLSFAR